MPAVSPAAVGAFATVLAEGWTSTVFAIDERSVVKVLRDPRAVPELPSDQTIVEEGFAREEQALRCLAGLPVPELRRRVEVGGRPALVLERIEGPTMQALLDMRGAIPTREAASFVVAVLQAVDTVHERGWLHGDLNPRNIALCGRQVTLLDLGAAVPLARPYPYSVPLGRHRFMALEHLELFRGSRPDVTADVHQCGALLLTLVSGREPLRPPTADEVYWTSYLEALSAMAREPSSRRVRAGLRGSTVSSRITEILERAMAADRRVRFQSASDMAEELADAL